MAERGLDTKAVAAAAKAGRLLRLTDNLVLLPDAAERAAELLAWLPQPFTVSQARQALGTTRRVILPLLDHLDRRKITRRLPDDRRTPQLIRSALISTADHEVPQLVSLDQVIPLHRRRSCGDQVMRQQPGQEDIAFQHGDV